MQVDPDDVSAFCTHLVSGLEALRTNLLGSLAEGSEGSGSEEGVCEMCGRDTALTKHHLVPRYVCDRWIHNRTLLVLKVQGRLQPLLSWHTCTSLCLHTICHDPQPRSNMDANICTTYLGCLHLQLSCFPKSLTLQRRPQGDEEAGHDQ